MFARGLMICAVAVLALTGCNPECTDRQDCKRYETSLDGAPSATFTCVANKCVQGDPGGGSPPNDGGK